MSRPRIMFKLFESASQRNPTEEESVDAYVLGWVMELLQFAILTSDDIVDNDDWRRGRWSWHKQPGVGRGALYDTFTAVFLALDYLKTRLHKHARYVAMVESINREMFLVQLYQSLDTTIATQGPGNVSTFSIHKFCENASGLCGYYYLPVALMLHYLGLDTPANLNSSKKITTELAIYYQAQNDYLDLYGDREVGGKGGRDIRENKCSWLVVEAVKLCNDEQRAVLKAKYGHPDMESVEEVKQIFAALNLQEAFKIYQSDAVSHIRELIESLDEREGLKKEVFYYFLEIILLVK